MSRLKRRFPNFVSVPEEARTEHEFSTLDEMLEIDWVKNLIQQPSHQRFSISSEGWGDGKSALMAELEGGTFYVVGFLWLDSPIDLPEWEYPKERARNDDS